MIVMFAPFEALLQAGRDGWTRTHTGANSSVWKHANGLDLLAQQDVESLWRVCCSIQNQTLSLSLPRMYARPLGKTLDPLLDDLVPWLADIDMEQRQRISKLVEAWLVHHGKTGSYRFVMTGPWSRPMLAEPETVEDPTDRLVVPHKLLEFLRADIEEFWARAPSPDHGFQSLAWTPGYPRQGNSRRWTVELPRTQHARLESLRLLSPKMKAIALEDPKFKR